MPNLDTVRSGLEEFYSILNVYFETEYQANPESSDLFRATENCTDELMLVPEMIPLVNSNQLPNLNKDHPFIVLKRREVFLPNATEEKNRKLDNYWVKRDEKSDKKKELRKLAKEEKSKNNTTTKNNNKSKNNTMRSGDYIIENNLIETPSLEVFYY